MNAPYKVAQRNARARSRATTLVYDSARGPAKRVTDENGRRKYVAQR